MVVLSMLAIITLLFAVASARLVAGQRLAFADLTLARYAHRTQSLVDIALKTFGTGPGKVPFDQPLDLQWGDARVTLYLRDVAGLIDLNTAPADMLRRLAEASDLPVDRVAAFAAAREPMTRLQRVADFRRIVGASDEAMAVVSRVATVVSGRQGIDPDAAPIEVLEVLAGRSGTRADLALSLDRAWIAPPTDTTFRVLAVIDGAPERALGIVAFGAISDVVLELR
ncbi:hypothetical protein ATO11_11450 [Pseudaestuariivita atlantica]|uniref:General secretion pathway protein GspK n=1 Tax=Pseudaestuariivita atlantica TaxID=1317121 RepID=A0A0L1JQU6_9RHOB|nr:hypothetical protein ATO11_11450 [Pseudaestuariivita atlantica]